ncbi:MAG: hypothetical protein AAFR11_08740 [Pseudomonadota bacterium]
MAARLLTMGAAGLGILVALNLFAKGVLEKPNAIPLSGAWWSDWSAGFIIFGLMLLMGLVALLGARSR